MVDIIEYNSFPIRGKVVDLEAIETASEQAEQAVETANQAVATAQTAIAEAEDARDFVQGITSELAPSIKSDALSGSIVEFDNGAKYWPVNSMLVDVQGYQEGSGDPSPTNVRAIHGWTGANVTRSGFNIWNGTKNSGYVTNTGDVNPSDAYYHTDYVSVIPNKSYFFYNIGGTNPSICWYDSSKVFISGEKNNGAVSKTLTAPSNAYYVRASFPVETANDFCINLSDSLHNGEYGPAEVATFPVAFPSEAGTVYKGELDVTRGKLRVDWAVVDLGTLNWVRNTAPNLDAGYNFQAAVSNYYALDRTKRICSKYIADVGTNGLANIVNIYGSSIDKIIFNNNAVSVDNHNIYIIDSAYTDTATFKSSLSGVLMAYGLQTPQEYDLTPAEVTTILGQNYIWADCGDVKELIVTLDTKEYIDSIRLAPVDQYVLDNLDGTLATYRELMRYWFYAHGADTLTAKEKFVELTKLVDDWYTLVRPIWDGGVRFAQPDYSTSSSGTKVGDNEGLSCAPSSNTVHGASDYEGNPLFIPTDVNFIVDPDTREPIITAIDGITSNFTRYNPRVFVGVMQMTGWVAQTEESETYTIWYSSTQGRHEGSKPLSEAVRFSDNTVRPWVIHSKYGSQTIGGKLTSFSGGLPTSFNISHNTLHTLAAATGTGYSGMCYCDEAFLYLMNTIKYAFMTADGTMMQGCVNSNWQYPALVAETGVKRILVTVAQGANIHEGMQVLVGDTAGNLDRGQAAMRSISGADGCKVVAKNTVTIDGTEYAAITVDVADVFNTTANGAGVSGTTYISSFGWACGANDNILGFDGNCIGSTSGNAPATIQGIEFMNGKYEVIADTILDLYQDGDDYFYEPKTVKNTSNQATSVTANYVATGLKCKQPASSSWQYIKKLGYAEGMFFPIEIGASASTYTRDGFYMNGATTGTREALLFGALYTGSGNGGLSSVAGLCGLSLAAWDIASRLSPNGNRGEFAA